MMKNKQCGMRDFREKCGGNERSGAPPLPLDNSDSDNLNSPLIRLVRGFYRNSGLIKSVIQYRANDAFPAFYKKS